MFIIPNQETKSHLQENKNNLSGTIYKSKNIDLDEEGYIKMSAPSFAVMTTDNDADFDTVDAMLPSNSTIFLNSGQVFSGDMNLNVLTNRTADTNKPTPNVEEDVVFFNETEVVSDDGVVKYRSASTTWTSVTTSFTSSEPIAMCAWESEGSLVVGNNNLVKFINTSWTVNATVCTLPVDYQVSSLAVQGNQLFIATRSKSGQKAKLFTINTIQVGIDYAYDVGTFEIMSVKPFKSSVALITSLGQLLRFNGGGFDTLGQLPVYKTSLEWCDASNDYSTVANRAMTTDGDLIYINLSSLTQNGFLKMIPDFLSGIWCYDDINGSLYHKYSPSATTIQIISGSNVTVDTSANTFTLTSGNLNNIVTGMPVLFNEVTDVLTPLKESVAYYIIKTSSTVFKLATSYTNAIAGTAIDITTAGNTGQQWFVFKTLDYGWGLYGNRMAVAVLNNNHFDSTRTGRICFTADLTARTSYSTDLTVFNGVSPFLPNRSYFVTPRLNSSDIEDEYGNVHIKYFPLGPDDKIIIKYKDIDKRNYPFSSVQYGTNTNWNATWTSTTVFTSVADLSSVVAGDEVEIISGVGAGHIANIVSISESTGTYTVTLEEEFPFAVANDVMRFNIDNFTKLCEITSSSNEDTKGTYKIPLGRKSKFVQLKVEMRGTGIVIEELIINNTAEKRA